MWRLHINTIIVLQDIIIIQLIGVTASSSYRFKLFYNIPFLILFYIKGKDKAIPLTGQSIIDNKVVRRRGTQIFLTINLQMAVRLSALHAIRDFSPGKDSWYSFLLEAESTTIPDVRLKGLGQLKNPVTYVRN
jgi:hypothetical protein